MLNDRGSPSDYEREQACESRCLLSDTGAVGSLCMQPVPHRAHGSTSAEVSPSIHFSQAWRPSRRSETYSMYSPAMTHGLASTADAASTSTTEMCFPYPVPHRRTVRHRMNVSEHMIGTDAADTHNRTHLRCLSRILPATRLSLPRRQQKETSTNHFRLDPHQVGPSAGILHDCS